VDNMMESRPVSAARLRVWEVHTRRAVSMGWAVPRFPLPATDEEDSVIWAAGGAGRQMDEGLRGEVRDGEEGAAWGRRLQGGGSAGCAGVAGESPPPVAARDGGPIHGERGPEATGTPGEGRGARTSGTVAPIAGVGGWPVDSGRGVDAPAATRGSGAARTPEGVPSVAGGDGGQIDNERGVDAAGATGRGGGVRTPESVLSTVLDSGDGEGLPPPEVSSAGAPVEPCVLHSEDAQDTGSSGGSRDGPEPDQLSPLQCALMATVCMSALAAAGRRTAADGDEVAEGDDPSWQHEYVGGILTWASYVREHGPGQQTFSWLYSPLLLDALEVSNSPRFARPEGWDGLVIAYRNAIRSRGLSAPIQRRLGYNGIYVDARMGHPLQGRHAISTRRERDPACQSYAYLGADDQNRLLGTLPATAARLQEFAIEESRHPRDPNADRPEPPPLPGVASMWKELQALQMEAAVNWNA